MEDILFLLDQMAGCLRGIQLLLAAALPCTVIAILVALFAYLKYDKH